MTDTQRPTEERLLGADFVRAAACLVVLAHHLGQRMYAPADFGLIDGLSIFGHIGAFGVAMFFVLSGYLLAGPFWAALDAGRPIPSLKVYALRRAARIFPGYWLALVVTFVLSIIVFGARVDGQLILRFVVGIFAMGDWHWVTLFPAEINGPLWSISFEVTSYILLPLAFIAIIAFGSRLPRWATRLAWMAVIGITLGAHLLFVAYFPIDNVGRSWNNGLVGGAKTWMPLYNPFSFFAMFAIGSLAAGVQLRLAGRRRWVFDLVALAAIAMTVVQFWLQLKHPIDSGYAWLGIPYAYPWFPFLVAALLAVAPSTVLVGRLLDNPVSVFIARISFGIYIWHYLIMELVRTYWDRDLIYGGHYEQSRFVVTALIVVGLSVAAGLLSFYLVERPAIRWARGLENRPGPAPISATAPAE